MFWRYFKLSEMSIKSMLAYRTLFLGGLAQSVLTVIALWFLWKAIFASAGTAEIHGLTFEVMITYIVISTFIRPLGWSDVEHDIEYDVRFGRITRNLTIPMSYPLFRFFGDLGEATYLVLTRGLPILLGAIFIVKVSPPASLLFFVSIIFSYLINFLLAFLTGLWVFWSGGKVWGLRLSRQMISDMVSGSLMPLYFFPAWLFSILQLLPFAAAFHIPLSIYIGKISGTEIFSALGFQILWILILLAIVGFVWDRAKKKIFSQGG